ncbi:hypothetical protein [Camelimonas lactis]|uniref:hypothetical protein n=1 Tax=Camelimonas lactis TaxID=659006 RepID=UPI00104B0528|nr:hypothetical protein [Camelimonas lactis]
MKSIITACAMCLATLPAIADSFDPAVLPKLLSQPRAKLEAALGQPERCENPGGTVTFCNFQNKERNERYAARLNGDRTFYVHWLLSSTAGRSVTWGQIFPDGECREPPAPRYIAGQLYSFTWTCRDHVQVEIAERENGKTQAVTVSNHD